MPALMDGCFPPTTPAAVAATITQLVAIRCQKHRINEFPCGDSGQSKISSASSYSQYSAIMRAWPDEKPMPIVERAIQIDLTHALGPIEVP
jgi:hypothetical protein